jgi:hypothetical protein
MAPSESAATLAWLEQQLGEPADAAWPGVRSEMEEQPAERITYSGHWVSDPWPARSSESDVVGLMPVWAPPQHVDEWPSHGAREIANELGDWARTNHPAFERLTDGGGPAGPADGVSAVEAVRALRVAGEERVATAGWGSEPMIQFMHVVAWLDTAVSTERESRALAGHPAPVRGSGEASRRNEPCRLEAHPYIRSLADEIGFQLDR